jgi:uncharacterized membrane protein
MNTNFDDFESDRLVNDPTNYKWGIFYFNPRDKRIALPKRYKMMGWTLNFANIYTYLILLGLIAAILITKTLG